LIDCQTSQVNSKERFTSKSAAENGHWRPIYKPQQVNSKKSNASIPQCLRVRKQKGRSHASALIELKY